MKDEDFNIILNAIKSDKCLAFLGAGVSTSFRKNDIEVPGLPSGPALAEFLAAKCQYPNGNIHNLADIAEYFIYCNLGDREPLEKAIKERIQITCTPRPIHTVLAQLTKIKIVITSNYDTLLEREFETYGRKLSKHVYNPQNPRTGHFDGTTFFSEGDIVLHKMHGSIDEPGSMVITESDYIKYLANFLDIDKGMPEYFRKTMIPQCSLLFLGYSLNDWNFRVIWEGVLENYSSRNTHKGAYALVKNPNDQQVKYWTRRNIDIIDTDLTEFAVKLAAHYNLEIPQLDIKKRVEGVER